MFVSDVKENLFQILLLFLTTTRGFDAFNMNSKAGALDK